MNALRNGRVGGSGMSDDEVRALFAERFLGWIVNDVTSAIQTANNFMVAQSLMSYIEVLGGVVTGKGAMERQASRNFNAAIRLFPQGYRDLDQNLEVLKPDGTTTTGIYSVFRCGLIHEYAAKGPCVVFNNPDGTTPAHEGLRVELHHGRNFVAIHNNALFRDFRAALEQVNQHLVNGDEPWMAHAKATFERASGYQVAL